MSRRMLFIIAMMFVAAPSFAEQKKEVRLFNGKDFSGWTYYLRDKTAKLEDVWSVKPGGVLHCIGRPVGYLRTEAEFENYKLTLEWRFPPGSNGGNSGVLLHTSTPNALGVWPKSIEAQLSSGDAGDIWVIGTTIQLAPVAPAKSVDVENRVKKRRHLNLTDGSEKAIGEWNRYEIICNDDTVLLKVNRDVVNYATQASVRKGAICLQSEGAPIEFRNIVLSPLD